MERLIKYCFFCLFFIFVSCSSSEKTEANSDDLHSKVEKQVVKNLRYCGLLASATGWQMYIPENNSASEKEELRRIRILTLWFGCFHEVSLEQGRALMVKAIQEYLSEIEKEPEFQKFLYPLPVSEKNLDIVIFFNKRDYSGLGLNKVSQIEIDKGMIFYYVEGPSEKVGKRKIREHIKVHEESYQDALKALAEQETPSESSRS